MTQKSLGAISPKSASYIKKASVILDAILADSDSYASFVYSAQEKGLTQEPHAQRVLSMLQYKLLKRPAPEQGELDDLAQALESTFGGEGAAECFKTMALMALDEEDGPISENAQNWCLTIFKQNEVMRCIIPCLDNIVWEDTPSPSANKTKVLAKLWEHIWPHLGKNHFPLSMLGKMADRYSAVEDYICPDNQLVCSVQTAINNILLQNWGFGEWTGGGPTSEDKAKEMKSRLIQKALGEVANIPQAIPAAKPKI